MVSIIEILINPVTYLGIFWFFNLVLISLLIYKKVTRVVQPLPEIDVTNEKEGTVKTILSHSYLKTLLVSGRNIPQEKLVIFVYNEIFKSIALAFHIQTRRLQKIHNTSDRVLNLFQNNSVRHFLRNPQEWEKDYYKYKRVFIFWKVREYNEDFITEISNIIRIISWELQFRRQELHE